MQYPWEYRKITEADCHTDRKRRPGETIREWFLRLAVADECFKRLHPREYHANRRKKGIPAATKDGVPEETRIADSKRQRADRMKIWRIEKK